jgi:uncharacterized protein YcbK (DUF882 family)
MSSRACAAYLGALVSLASPVPLSGEPSPPPVSPGRPPRAAEDHRTRKGVPSASPAGAEPQGGSKAIGLSSQGDNDAETPATLVNVHSNESLALDERSPSDERFSRLLPDRTSGEMRRFDPRLLGVLRRIAARHPGVRIELVSGYRSPKFNEHLRKKGHRVASHSEHSRGHALDFRVEGLSPAQVVAEVRAQGWSGGVGRYDGAGDRFVHVDVGRNRFWMGR